MERLHPGVYVEEVQGGARPLEGVSTSTAAFLGKAETGPLDRAVLVTDFIDFQANYGGFLADSYLAHAALQFFNNGGKRLYIVRVARDAATADIRIGDRKGAPASALTITAASPGRWGNQLEAVVTNGTLDAADEFNLLIRFGDVVETYSDLSVDPAALNFADNVVNARSRLVRIAVDQNDVSTVAGTSVSGAGAQVTLPPDRRRLRIDVNGDGPQTVELSGAVGTGGEIATAITNAVRGLVPLRGSTPAAAFSVFAATFNAGVYTLTSGATGRASSVRVTDDPTGSVAALLKLGTTNGGSETTGAAVLRPASGTFLIGDGAAAGTTLAVTLGSDGSTPQDSDYLQAFTQLDPMRDVNIVAVPGIGTKPVVDFGSTYCQGRTDCFYVADLPSTVDSREEAQTFVNGLTVKSSYAAVYFPWLSMVDPTGAAPEPVPVPPSGFVTGMYARTDAQRGVWKAPAGTAANLGGATGLAVRLTDAEQDTLNPIGVNAIRFFPSSGIVIWGARTLAGPASREYLYVPVRRLAIFLEQTIYNGVQWAVFEPNDEDLWASLRLNIGAFMMTQFRAGAFQGNTPDKAFFVKCDSQTNPQDQIDAGIVTVLVGFAPVKPAEFVVIKISQKTAEGA
jgi:uncharacterized protein